MVGCKRPILYAGLYRPCTILKDVQTQHIHRAVQALHYTQDFVGPALYAGLSGLAMYKGLHERSSICRVLQALYYSQGCTGPALQA